MWQRIQTLYLLISVGLFTALFFSPLASAVGQNGQSENINFVDFLPFLYLMISILAAHVIALGLGFSRHRGVQMRVSTIAALLALGFQIWIAFKYFTAPDGIVYKPMAVFPVICAILDALAIRGMASDILLVESVGRLRSRKRGRK